MNIKEYFTKKEKAFSNRKDKNFLLTSVILGVLFLVAIAIAKPQFYAFRNLSSILIQSSAVAIMGTKKRMFHWDYPLALDRKSTRLNSSHT